MSRYSQSSRRPAITNATRVMATPMVARTAIMRGLLGREAWRPSDLQAWRPADLEASCPSEVETWRLPEVERCLRRASSRTDSSGSDHPGMHTRIWGTYPVADSVRLA